MPRHHSTSALPPRARRVASLVRPLVGREIRSRYRTTSLDIVWAFLTPIVTMTVYGVILTQSFGVESSCGPYLVSAWSGLVLWTFFSVALTAAVTSILSSANLVGKIYFPRESLPLAAAGSALVDLAVGMVTVVILIVLGGVGLSWYTLLALIPVAILVVWTAAISVFVSVAAVFLRDVVQVVYLVVRIGIFATPVFYESSQMPDFLARTEPLNPVAVAIESVRTSALCGKALDFGLLGWHLAAAIGSFLAAVLYTRSVEARAIDLL